jgi:hypothetical protein
MLVVIKEELPTRDMEIIQISTKIIIMVVIEVGVLIKIIITEEISVDVSMGITEFRIEIRVFFVLVGDKHQ